MHVVHPGNDNNHLSILDHLSLRVAIALLSLVDLNFSDVDCWLLLLLLLVGVTHHEALVQCHLEVVAHPEELRVRVLLVAGHQDLHLLVLVLGVGAAHIEGGFGRGARHV